MRESNPPRDACGASSLARAYPAHTSNGPSAFSPHAHERIRTCTAILVRWTTALHWSGWIRTSIAGLFRPALYHWSYRPRRPSESNAARRCLTGSRTPRVRDRLFSCGRRIRTYVGGSKALRPAVGRAPQLQPQGSNLDLPRSERGVLPVGRDCSGPSRIRTHSTRFWRPPPLPFGPLVQDCKWRRWDLNPRPSAYEADELPLLHGAAIVPLGLEPRTSAVSERRADRCATGHHHQAGGIRTLFPGVTTPYPCRSGRAPVQISGRVSNPRPPRWQRGALPTELTAQHHGSCRTRTCEGLPPRGALAERCLTAWPTILTRRRQDSNLRSTGCSHLRTRARIHLSLRGIARAGLEPAPSAFAGRRSHPG